MSPLAKQDQTSVASTKKELNGMQLHSGMPGVPDMSAGGGAIMGLLPQQGADWNQHPSMSAQQAQQQLFALQQSGAPPQGPSQGGWVGGGGFVGAPGMHPGAYFNQTQIGAMVSGMMGGAPHMQGGGINQMAGMGGFAPVGAAGAFAPPNLHGNHKRSAADFAQGQNGEAGDGKSRKAPKRSLAATIERMEKHKILERKRRERTKELVAELMVLVPGIECIGDSPTMNSVLGEAIHYLKESQWEAEQRLKHPCTCGAPGVGSNPMPPRPRDADDRDAASSSATAGSNSSTSRSDGSSAQLEDAGAGQQGHLQQF